MFGANPIHTVKWFEFLYDTALGLGIKSSEKRVNGGNWKINIFMISGDLNVS